MQESQVAQTTEPSKALPSFIKENTTIVVDNLLRQHREGGILERSIPALSVTRDTALYDVRQAVKAIEAQLGVNAQSRHKATKASEFKALLAEEKELIAALVLAKQARTDATAACEPHQLIKSLRGYVKASAYVRTQQVIEALGALQQVELTPEMETELEGIKAEMKAVTDLQKYRQRAYL